MKWFALALLAILTFSFILAGCANQPAEQVKIDFLYADWCTHCVAAKPVVERVAGEFNGAVNVTLYNEAARKTDNATAKLYADYKAREVFGGFPTLVAHGEKGEQKLVGERNESELKSWMCAQFVKAPPNCVKAS